MSERACSRLARASYLTGSELTLIQDETYQLAVMSYEPQINNLLWIP